MGWIDLIGPALQIGGAYLQYNDKKNRASDLNRQYQAYLNAREVQAQNSGGGSRSGGGGGKSAAANILADYLKKSQDRYAPILDAAMKTLPQQTALYQGAMPGATNFVNSALSPEAIADAMTFNRPIQPDLPSYLVGGKK